MAASALRSFLYLDSTITDDYVAAVEGALADEAIVRQSGRKKGGVGAALTAGPVQVGGDRSTETNFELTQTTSESPAGRFQRLHSRLDQGGDLCYFNQFTPETWKTVARGVVLECEVTISPTKLSSLAQLSGGLAALAGAMSAISGQQMLDDKAKQAVEGISAIAKTDRNKGIPIKMAIVDSPKYTLVAYLVPEFLRVDESRITGEATILAKVQRVIMPGDSIHLFDISEMIQGLPRNQRRKMKAIPPAVSDVVRAPAAVVVPIAIYR